MKIRAIINCYSSQEFGLEGVARRHALVGGRHPAALALRVKVADEAALPLVGDELARCEAHAADGRYHGALMSEFLISDFGIFFSRNNCFTVPRGQP